MLVLAAFVGVALTAQADEYGDVTQLLRSGKHAEALTKADQYLAGKPKDPQMRFIKGVIQSESGKPNDAIATFNTLTQEYPELPEPYNNLAVLYASQNQYDKARTALEMAIKTNPSYATAHENLGDVYAKLASQAYSKALQLDNSNTAIQPKLALIRELFAPGKTGGKAPTPVAPAPVAAAPTPAPAKSPAPAVAAVPVATTPAAAAPAPAAPAPAAPSSATAPSSTTASTSAAPAVSATPPSPAGNADKEVESAVRAWAAAWSARDMSGYLGAYGKDFETPGKKARKAWEDERRSRIVGKSRIVVKLSDLNISVNGNKATARFRQDYSADSLNVSSRKVLDLSKAGDRWVIVRESTGG
jgi:tetratricopeptide (TPR) repeat protein